MNSIQASNSGLRYMAELLRKESGISDIDILLCTPSERWTEHMSVQAISQIGCDIEDDSSEEGIRRNMERLQKLMTTHKLEPESISTILIVLDGHWDDVPPELSDIIEKKAGAWIRFKYEKSEDSICLPSIMLRTNPEMLKRILKTCNKGWFRAHYTLTEMKGKRTRVHGICASDDPELFQFIGEVRGIKWDDKQAVMMEDILDYWNPENKKAKSQRGFVTEVVCNSREQYVPIQFSCILEKIPIESKKGHNTPDWLMMNGEGKAFGTVECFAGDAGSFRERVRKAVKHGDSKEFGKDHYIKRFGLPDDSLKIAAYVCGTPLYLPRTDDWIEDVLKSIPDDTHMDGLLFIWASESTHETDAVYFDISGRDVCAWLKEDVAYCPISGC